jgi:replicative DNA helicase
LKLGLTEPEAYVDDGVKPVYRITTGLGRSVEATAAHPFLTLEGWKRLEELLPGERIAVPRTIPVFGTETIRECEVKLLGYFLGDGGLTDNCPEFTNSNPRLRADFAEAITAFTGVKVREENSEGPRTPTLCVSGDDAFIAEHRADFARRLKEAMRAGRYRGRQVAKALGVSPALVCLWGKSACVPNPTTFAALCRLLRVEPTALAPHSLPAISRHSKNPVTLWLQEMGLWGKGAGAKVIPPTVFRLTRPQVALLLNRLFATDGWATVLSAGAGQLGYASASERLVRQIQHLLLRFGIVASLRRRAIKYRGTRRWAWQLDITDQKAIRTFIAQIGIFGKEEALAAVERSLEGKTYKPSRDLIPAAVWRYLASAKGGESWGSLARRAGLGEQTNLHVGRRGLTRARLARFAEALGDERLRELATSDVYWDRIRSIEPVGPRQVYDLTIPQTHNFIANDVCVHNTAFSLNIVRNMIIQEQRSVFFVSLEMSRLELAERLLCCHGKVDSHRLRKGHLSGDDMQKLMEAGDLLSKAKLFIDDSPAQGMLRISANARRLKMRHGLDIVFIDYLQLIEPDNKRDSRQEQVANISRRLKFLAKELEIPVIALAQVNRSSEDRQDHRPRLSDLRESGSLEQDADTVMLLHRPDAEPGQVGETIDVIIAKQRNGPTDTITLTFLKQFMRFENFAVEAPFSYGS